MRVLRDAANLAGQCSDARVLSSKIAAWPIHRGTIKLADDDDMEFELGERLMITQNGRPMLDLSRDGAVQLRSLIGSALAHRP